MTRATGTGPFRLLMYGLILASAAAQFALVPIMPVYAHRLGLSGFQQGLVLGATGLATLGVSVPAGALSDRFGARRITLAAGLLMAAATFGQALAGSFPALLAARLAFGAGYGVLWTAGCAGWPQARTGRGPWAARWPARAWAAWPGPRCPARSPSTWGWPSRCWPRARSSR